MTGIPGSAAPPVLQVAVFGAGSFGQNHIRVYRQLEQDGLPVHLAAVVDPALVDPALVDPLFGDPAFADPAFANPAFAQRATTDTARHIAPAAASAPRLFTSTEACFSALAAGEIELHAASICTPTSAHAAVAQAALAAGLHVLVEKPLTRTLAEADALIASARAAHRILQVGHLERFNPAVQAFLPHLNHPMFFEAHRLSIFTPRSLDVDVVLDLMVHDLDVVLTFANSPVREIRAVGLPILSRKTDIANVRVEFESGCVANFTASRVSTERVRKLRFFQPRQYVSLDYARQEILLIETTAAPDPATAGAAQPALSLPRGLAAETRVPAEMPGAPSRTPAFGRRGGTIAAGDPFSPSDSAGLERTLPGLKITKPPVTPGEPLRLEIEAFLHAIRTGTPPVVSGEAGRAALALALDITAAIEAHLERTNLQPR